MQDVVAIAAPVFGLILLGIVIGRANYLSTGSSKILAEFGFKLAMPALLFKGASSIATLSASPIPLIGAYFAASVLVWLLATVATRIVLARPSSDAPAVAMASCFGNTVMLGIPIAVTAFGVEATTPAAILVSIETPLLWVIATLQAEMTRTQSAGLSKAALSALGSELVTNPIVMALVVGLAFGFSGLVLPAGLDRMVNLLAQAAVPTALVALGLTLSAIEVRGEAPTLALISTLKLLLFPVLVVATFTIVNVPPVWASVALLFAAMPSGANAYLFAVRYDRVVNSVAGAIVITTVLAGATVSLLLIHLGAGGSP